VDSIRLRDVVVPGQDVEEVAIIKETLRELRQCVVALNRIQEVRRAEFDERVSGEMPHQHLGQRIVWINRDRLFEQCAASRGVAYLQGIDRFDGELFRTPSFVSRRRAWRWWRRLRCDWFRGRDTGRAGRRWRRSFARRLPGWKRTGST
jgi:hypothetical protein